ncbi:substrate-binding domain-containing protein [Streptomyces sp. 8N616]|uniref:substrate-binding domain-containing protein n=1 Tax=Streptomyces sp. 8N616 TaxID=3457414 RepID=UPI003FD6936E
MDEMSTVFQASGEPTGRVVVGSTTLFMEYEMGELVRECRYRYPRVEISPKVMAAREIEEAVASGKVDIGLNLVESADEGSSGNPGITRQRLFPIPFVPVGNRPDTPPATTTSGGAPIECVLAVDPHCVAHNILLRHLKATHGIDPPIMEAGSARSALGLARAGLGIAMVPQSAVGDDLAEHGLAVLDGLPRAQVYVQALWGGGDTWLSSAVSAFLDLLRHARGTTARQALTPAFQVS